MNQDQQRKLLISILNHRWRDPSLDEKSKTRTLTDLLKIVNKLPGEEITLQEET